MVALGSLTGGRSAAMAPAIAAMETADQQFFGPASPHFTDHLKALNGTGQTARMDTHRINNS